MTFLKKAKAFLPTQSVKYLLHSHLNGPDPARPMSRMHASELTKPDGFCPRHYALADATKTKPKDNWLTTSEEVTFHIGRVLQDAVVNWFADMGKAFCHWKCQGCGHMPRIPAEADEMRQLRLEELLAEGGPLRERRDGRLLRRRHAGGAGRKEAASPSN